MTALEKLFEAMMKNGWPNPAISKKLAQVVANQQRQAITNQNPYKHASQGVAGSHGNIGVQGAGAIGFPNTGAGAAVPGPTTGGTGIGPTGPYPQTSPYAAPENMITPILFDGAVIVLRTQQSVRFMNYTKHWVTIDQNLVRVIDKTGGAIITIYALSSIIGVFKNSTEAIKAWVIEEGVPDADISVHSDSREDAVPDVSKP